MSREWKPGDDIGPIVINWNGTAVATLLRTLEKHYEPGYRALWSAIHRANAPSPLVVIDPEDREAVERLAHLMHDFDSHLADDPHRESAWVSLAGAALREFANPTPPKPEEPQGLGAVVEDEDGSILTRISTMGRRDWVTAYGTPFAWADIAAVRVLSAGVEVSA